MIQSAQKTAQGSPMATQSDFAAAARQILSSADKKLHHKFKYFGSKHLEFRRKCLGLLPKIYKEEIYKKKGFGTIFEYAEKLAGLTQEQIKRALSLHDTKLTHWKMKID